MLVSTGDLRSWLNLSSTDTDPNAKLETLINAVEDFCDNYTGRILEATTYSASPAYNYFDGTGERFFYLPNYPVSAIGTVYVDADREWTSGTAIASADLVIYWDSGKIYSEAEYFIKGHRNIYITSYIAGYGALVGGTCGANVSTYGVPYDLKQVILELAAQSFKEGLTLIHTVAGVEEVKMLSLLRDNSFIKQTLDKYKNYSAGLYGNG